MAFLLFIGACFAAFAVFGFGAVFNYRGWRDWQTDTVLHLPFWRWIPRGWRTETNAPRLAPWSRRLLDWYALFIDLAVIVVATFVVGNIVSQIATGNA